MWYPPAQSAPLPTPLVPLPWFPIRSSVMDRLAATPVRADLAPANALPVAAVVRCMADGAYEGRGLVIGVVQQWGLFPASALSTPVLLSVVDSITGLGVCLLSWPELAALGDVPILISDRLLEALDVELLRGFCLSAPAKVLFVCADALLTMSFRGGSSTFTFSPGLVADATPGPAPKTDVELGLAGLGLATAYKTQPHVRIVKGDTQKANSAAVPDHLWVHAFLCGYGREHHGPRHLQALDLSVEALVGGLENPSPPARWETTTSGLSTLALFRLFALGGWRRQVLRGFFA